MEERKILIETAIRIIKEWESLNKKEVTDEIIKIISLNYSGEKNIILSQEYKEALMKLLKAIL